MKRRFYFLRDSVTGLFYDGRDVLDGLSDFSSAATYHKLDNAKKKVKELTNPLYGGSFGWFQKCIDKLQNKEVEVIWSKSHDRKACKHLGLRRNLPNWGIEIVSVELVSEQLELSPP